MYFTCSLVDHFIDRCACYVGYAQVERAMMLEGEYAASRGKGFFVGELQAGQVPH
jgi:hypothetical protein